MFEGRTPTETNTMTRFFLLFALGFSSIAHGAVEEARSEADSREVATELAAELAAEQCEGAVVTVGTRTESVNDSYVAQVWYVCTPSAE